MLVRKFYLSDLKAYEENTGKSIIKLFEAIDLLGIIDLIRLGNGNCDESLACDILDTYLENYTLTDALVEMKECLLGKTDTESEDGIDASEYRGISEIYNSFCMQLMSLGVSYSEFWGMSTKDMYEVFDSIQLKIEAETNRQLAMNHTLAAMVGGAVWGKLDKEPPRVNGSNKVEKTNDINNMDRGTFESVLALKSVLNKQQYVKGVDVNG